MDRPRRQDRAVERARSSPGIYVGRRWRGPLQVQEKLIEVVARQIAVDHRRLRCIVELRLDIVDLGSGTVTGSAVITDGYHWRMDMTTNGQIFIGSYNCTNIGNGNNPSGEVRGQVLGLVQRAGTRALDGRFAVENPRDELLPGMHALIRLGVPAAPRGGPSRPRARR